MNDFPVYACEYSRKLANASKRFALQVYDPPEDLGAPSISDTDEKLSPDPFGELSRDGSLPKGLVRRFTDRVLIMTAEQCFMACRHCTRRGILGKAEIVRTDEELFACRQYVADNPEIRDVLLSGGDILTLDDERVMRFVDAFTSLEQIDIVRVCTRAPCTNPARITPELAKALGSSGKVWVNTQFNCADEVTPEASNAAKLLVEAGIPVSCQTVLLKGVNDSTDEMLKLFRALGRARIRPYYVFVCDPVSGTERFRVDAATACRIERECAEAIGGLSMPRFVADLPNAKRKTPVSELCTT